MHVFESYAMTGRRVHARCSCGYESAGQPSQLLARRALVTTHELTPMVCAACGRGDGTRVQRGIAAGLRLHTDPRTGEQRLVCAEGSGGCDLVSQLGPRAAGEVRAATTIPPAATAAGSELHASVGEYRASVISMAVGILIERANLSVDEATARLAQHAGHLDINVTQAAHLVLVAAARRRRPQQRP